MTAAQPPAYTAYGPSDPTDIVGRRVGAFLIDFVLLLIVGFAIAVPVFLGSATTTDWPAVSAASEYCDRVNNPDTGSGDGVCVNVQKTTYHVPSDKLGGYYAKAVPLGLLPGFLNYVVLQSITGASIGKLLIGLRVVRHDGGIAGFGWMTLRWLLLLVDGFCCYIVGIIMIASTKGHRRLGDMAAGTLVVDKHHVGRPLQVPGVTEDGYYGAGYQGGPSGPPPGYGSPPSAPGGADGPTWDAARNTYIQYDSNRGEWLEWDDTAKQWGPISR